MSKAARHFLSYRGPCFKTDAQGNSEMAKLFRSIYHYTQFVMCMHSAPVVELLVYDSQNL